jgi:hypothetical protein
VASERLDAKAAYVALSRGKRKARVFTPDKDALFNNLGKPVDRLAALDVLNKQRSNVINETEDEAFQRNIKNSLSRKAIDYAEDINHSADRNHEINEKDINTDTLSAFHVNPEGLGIAGYENDVGL